METRDYSLRDPQEVNVDFMDIKIDVIRKGIVNDPEYRGTGYREGSDLQQQVRRLRYKIVFEPNFYVYHLDLGVGGDRALNTASQRFYWKTLNNAYFIRKHKLGLPGLVASSGIVMLYSVIYGLKTSMKAFKDVIKNVAIANSNRASLTLHETKSDR